MDWAEQKAEAIRSKWWGSLTTAERPYYSTLAMLDAAIAAALRDVQADTALRSGTVEMLARCVEGMGLVAKPLPEGGFQICPPPGHVITERGLVRVDDKLVCTLDGVMVVPGDTVYASSSARCGFIVSDDYTIAGGDVHARDCYSTRDAREAAEAAAKGGARGQE